MNVVDLRGIDLNLLVSLDALLEEANVRRAARRLHLTQPALATQLARLRQIFGDPLLTPSPSGRGMTRSTRAMDLMAPLHDVLKQLEAVVCQQRVFDPLADKRRFTVSASDQAIAVPGFQLMQSWTGQAGPRSDGLVGRAPAFNEAISALQRVAPSTMPVLLLGESGTGKELFAHALHEASDRAHEPFVVVDCSGMTETLFESELFGYEKGSSTVASTCIPGLVETAQGGTLFLDEIGDVPLSIQVKLLRLIETGTFRRVGSIETLRADFRLVAATNKPLDQMLASGQFRSDLYFQISAFPIRLPALRDRVDDIPLLADSILRRIGSARGAAPRKASVAPDALARLCAYGWPGNLRELRNVLEHASLLADDGVIRPEHLPDTVRADVPPETHSAVPFGRFGRTRLTDAELVRIAAGFHGVRSELAAQLGISERTLYRRLKILGEHGSKGER